MSKIKRKRSVKTHEKCNALRDIEKGIPNKEVPITYGVDNNTILTCVKNKKFFKALESASSKKRKLRKKDFEKLDKVVFRWFVSKRSQNTSLDGTLIKEKESLDLRKRT